MSTRGFIARPTGHGKFAGRYHHFDSQPSGLGATLFRLYRKLGSNLNKMLSILIDKHHGGWSHVDSEKKSECYCHGSKKKTEELLVTERDASDMGCEYGYVLSQDGDEPVMTILGSYVGKRKMIGAFGVGDPKAKWKQIGKVWLNGEEPDWSARPISNKRPKQTAAGSKLEQYHAALLKAGVALLIPSDLDTRTAAKMISHVHDGKKDITAAVKFALKHGAFTDGKRCLLIVPPAIAGDVKRSLELLDQDAWSLLSRKRGVRVDHY